MIIKIATNLAFAAVCLASITVAQAQAPGYPGASELVTNGPPGSPPAAWSPRKNVEESRQYDRLLETDWAFRQARIKKECGPINDPQLHASCVASFGQDEPFAGSRHSSR